MTILDIIPLSLIAILFLLGIFMVFGDLDSHKTSAALFLATGAALLAIFVAAKTVLHP